MAAERPLRWWWPQHQDPATAAPLPAEQGALQAIGLTPENWEGISIGPAVSAEQPSTLLVSDDNLNPL